MNASDLQCVEDFLEKWLGSEGNERANYQTFFGDLCIALGVDSPPPKGSVDGDPYCFDKDLKSYSKKGASTLYADFYKEGCFLIEAKQGSTDSSKGHGKRGTQVYLDQMQGAFNQARTYAHSSTLSSPPPFLITCDIGSHFELWEGFSGEYGGYGARQRVNLADLKQEKVFDRFVAIFTDPQSLNPEKLRARVTREVAAELAKLSVWLEQQGHDPHETANFLMRCIFTMFAEDVGLLKEEVFTKALRDRWIPHPHNFKSEITNLWQTMNSGGMFGYDKILRFNGSFFEDAAAFDLPKGQLEVLYAAAAKDWSQVEPAIFGTLLERALGKKERSRLGAHYTPRSYVERLVRPVVMESLRQEWDEIELEIKRLLEPSKERSKGQQTKVVNQADKEIRAFLEKLRSIKVLDPACGTGNFLYVSMDLMKALEMEVLQRLEDVTGQSRDQLMLDIQQVQVNPSQFLGIEINPRAAAIAELVIWIGYLQWQFRQRKGTGFIEPVLQAFENIECRDAVLAYDGKEPNVDPKTGEVRTRWGGGMMRHPVTGDEVPDPADQVVIYQYLNPRPAEWPEADYVVSNPPFIGNARMREFLGDGYAETLRDFYPGVPETVDYVMYWWHKAASYVQIDAIGRFGFITTNSIRQPRLRSVIDFHSRSKTPIFLTFAIPDHPWVDEGADVRISMTGAEKENTQIQKIATLGTVTAEGNADNPEDIAEKIRINWKKAAKIYSNLQVGVNVSLASQLKSNSELACQGVKLHGKGFLLNRDQLDNLEHEFTFEFITGRELAKSRTDSFVLDLLELTEEKLKTVYPKTYQWILERVKPERDQNNRKTYREKWWIFGEPRATYRKIWKSLDRYIATTRTAKFRIFQFLPSNVISESGIVMIFLNDPYYLGILSSNTHVTWAIAAGGWMGVGNDPVYNHTRCFYTFPYPDSTPEHKQKIRDLGEQLDTHRKRVQAAHPDITITGMYNLLEKLCAGKPFTDEDCKYNNKALVSTLKQIHDELDIAVLDAYGWPHDITDDQILKKLVALNAERAEEERNGFIRWLYPEYQAPDEMQPQQVTIEGITEKEEPVIAPVKQLKWPRNKPKEQLAAIRDLLRASTSEWTAEQIAYQFKGKITQEKRDSIQDNLQRLEWFGLVIHTAENGIDHWQYTESAISA